MFLRRLFKFTSSPLFGGIPCSSWFHTNCETALKFQSEAPFHPTWPSTKQRVKEECLKHGPDNVVYSISAEAGGIVGASAPGKLPQDAQQVSNFKKKLDFNHLHQRLRRMQVAMTFLW